MWKWVAGFILVASLIGLSAAGYGYFHVKGKLDQVLAMAASEQGYPVRDIDMSIKVPHSSQTVRAWGQARLYAEDKDAPHILAMLELSPSSVDMRAYLNATVKKSLSDRVSIRSFDSAKARIKADHVSVAISFTARAQGKILRNAWVDVPGVIYARAKPYVAGDKLYFSTYMTGFDLKKFRFPSVIAKAKSRAAAAVKRSSKALYTAPDGWDLVGASIIAGEHHLRLVPEPETDAWYCEPLGAWCEWFA